MFVKIRSLQSIYHHLLMYLLFDSGLLLRLPLLLLFVVGEDGLLRWFLSTFVGFDVHFNEFWFFSWVSRVVFLISFILVVVFFFKRLFIILILALLLLNLWVGDSLWQTLPQIYVFSFPAQLGRMLSAFLHTIGFIVINLRGWSLLLGRLLVLWRGSDAALVPNLLQDRWLLIFCDYFKFYVVMCHKHSSALSWTLSGRSSLLDRSICHIYILFLLTFQIFWLLRCVGVMRYRFGVRRRLHDTLECRGTFLRCSHHSKRRVCFLLISHFLLLILI